MGRAFRTDKQPDGRRPHRAHYTFATSSPPRAPPDALVCLRSAPRLPPDRQSTPTVDATVPNIGHEGARGSRQEHRPTVSDAARALRCSVPVPTSPPRRREVADAAHARAAHAHKPPGVRPPCRCARLATRRAAFPNLPHLDDSVASALTVAAWPRGAHRAVHRSSGIG